MGLLGAGTVAASFYDPIVTGRSTTLDHLDTVTEEVGYADFEAVPFQYALHLGARLGQIDRYVVDPAAILQHIQHAMDSRERFYPSMDESDFRNYILPLRIRYEPLHRTHWRIELSEQLTPLLTDTTSPRQGAAIVLAWARQSIELQPANLTYLLRERGDMDPLSTLRGGYADPIDLTLFSIAALRSIGIQAQLVWVPNFSGYSGGKVWLEWRGESGEWHPWAVDGPTDTIDHRTWLQQTFSANWSIVLTRPEDPIPLTSSYVRTAAFHAVQTHPEDTPAAVEGSVMLLNANRLKPVMGRELGHRVTVRDSAELGAGNWWITRGVRPGKVGILAVRSQPDTALWYQLDLDSGKQLSATGSEAPAFFRSSSAPSAAALQALRLPSRRAATVRQAIDDMLDHPSLLLKQEWLQSPQRGVESSEVRIGWRSDALVILIEARAASEPSNSAASLNDDPAAAGDGFSLWLTADNSDRLLELQCGPDGQRHQVLHRLDRQGSIQQSSSASYRAFEVESDYQPDRQTWWLVLTVPSSSLGLNNLRSNHQLYIALSRSHLLPGGEQAYSSSLPTHPPSPEDRQRWNRITLAQP